MTPAGFAASVRRIVPLAWPVFVGQLAVLGFSTVDTVLVARHSATDLAALAVGSAAYVTVFIGLMGVVLALSPIVGQLFGARKLAEAGAQLHQAVWLALGLSLLGSAVLLFPAPFLALSQASPEVASKVRGYLLALAFSLPASLLFTAFRGFNVAVSRPKAVMALQLGGLALKIPLSATLVVGAPGLGLPALGVEGCGIATLVAMWAQAIAAWILLRRDPFYASFGLRGHGLDRPHGPSLKALLKLGVPMGLSILIEVTGFSFMAIFIARLGETPVAGHQIAANLVALLFMMPLGLSNATGTLVAQRIGAADLHDARRLGWHGMQLTLLVALVMGGGVYLARGAVVRLYTDNPTVIAAALPLVAWVALFHAADAVQTVAAFVLRAWRIATVPLVIYAVALWGVGLGGGFMLAFDDGTRFPAAWRGAPGFWIAATAGLAVAAAGLSLFLLFVYRTKEREAHTAVAATD
ncbi:MATE family efflux transporter [Aquincola sp. S2]|uniref:Multidrug-efflux transporter n=1 Tax=Pseudaquabacterium terrae TaxID=2732868 RepID=A0ABX2ENB5_9BURK|nr:MATE family efflux transporter [Aquabacterium terrae]NRF70130.1 MATE family efflux transporter [Aquabacterium terrae]